MALGRLATEGLARIAILYSMSIGTLSAAVTIDYASPMGGENWHMNGNRLRCSLVLTVPNYGIAYFEQYAARPAHFILSNWQQVERELPAIVYAKPPVWKPRGERYVITKTTVNRGEYGLYLSRDSAIKLLNYLAQGFQTNFQYLSEQGFPTTVSLSPIRFQKVYALYQRCLGNLLPFDYESVRSTVVQFETDNFDLSDEAKQQLHKIAEYSQADDMVKRIQISGYTDDTGA